MPPISCLYASPLNRAWQTAQPIAQRQGFFRRVAGAIDEIVGRPPGETVAVVPKEAHFELAWPISSPKR